MDSFYKLTHIVKANNVPQAQTYNHFKTKLQGYQGHNEHSFLMSIWQCLAYIKDTCKAENIKVTN